MPVPLAKGVESKMIRNVLRNLFLKEKANSKKFVSYLRKKEFRLVKTFDFILPVAT